MVVTADEQPATSSQQPAAGSRQSRANNIQRMTTEAGGQCGCEALKPINEQSTLGNRKIQNAQPVASGQWPVVYVWVCVLLFVYVCACFFI